MKIDSFKKSVGWLESFIPATKYKYPGELGLSRMKMLVKKLGNPQNNYPVILVAGTSGKGSTSTMISSILSQKLKVGLHVKPHLVTVRERIQINGHMISEKEFVQLTNLVKEHVEEIEKSSRGKPTYFEILVGMSYLYFSREKVDIAVFEVGMGGRLDGTNVVNPAISVITSIGFDHVPLLGTTLLQILNEKAGIIKNGSPVISGINQPELISQLNKICEGRKSEAFLFARDFQGFTKKIDVHGSTFNYEGIHNYNDLHLPVLGSHQINNALVAIRTVEELSNYPINQLSNKPMTARIKKFKLGEEDIRKGLRSVKIPGRMEIISKRPLIMLDGAHNEDKSKALVDSLKIIFPKKKITTILGIKKDKNASKILESLIQVSSEIILTEFFIYSDIGSDTSISLSDLKQILTQLNFHGKVKFTKDIEEAIHLAKSETGKDDMILITGSMYLIGKVKSEKSKGKSIKNKF